jgi:hypothetical protein
MYGILLWHQRWYSSVVTCYNIHQEFGLLSFIFKNWLNFFPNILPKFNFKFNYLSRIVFISVSVENIVNKYVTWPCYVKDVNMFFPDLVMYIPKHQCFQNHQQSPCKFQIKIFSWITAPLIERGWTFRTRADGWTIIGKLVTYKQQNSEWKFSSMRNVKCFFGKGYQKLPNTFTATVEQNVCQIIALTFSHTTDFDYFASEMKAIVNYWTQIYSEIRWPIKQVSTKPTRCLGAVVCLPLSSWKYPPIHFYTWWWTP